MMITRGKRFKIIMRLNRGTVLALGIPDRSSVLRNLPIHHIIPNVPA